MRVLEGLLARVEPRNAAYPTVVVDGRGASGKTTLADLLADHLDGYAVVHGDDYFEPHDHPVTWGDFAEERFDADVLSRIRAGERAIPVQPFDFPRGRLGEVRPLHVDRGLVVERWFGFGLDAPWDVRIWVETPSSVCLERGLGRDGGIALGERARLAWTTVWQPREEAYIAATQPQRRADLVLDGTRPFEPQL
ncbi:MAG: hypothetical protein U0R68_13230 [Candidatus Nanopelagicales bacterium]